MATEKVQQAHKIDKAILETLRALQIGLKFIWPDMWWVKIYELAP